MKDQSKIEPRTLKGFRDFAPQEQRKRQALLAAIQGVFERFGFAPLYTPALEYREILMNKYGEDEKLVYSFTDNGGRDVALRYDLTVPFARFVAQNKDTLEFPFKRYQIAPVWRAENTQRGRFREFYQCDIDTVGVTAPLADAEVIACLCLALEAAGAKNYEMRMSDRRLISVCFPNLKNRPDDLVIVMRGIDKLEKIGAPAVLEWMREQGLKPEDVEYVEKFLTLADSPNIFNALADQYEGAHTFTKEMERLMRTIMELGVRGDRITFDPFITRGLDYYTGVVFEAILKDAPEVGSVAGGGRYDTLIDQFSHTSLPGVGGSIGIDRLFDGLYALNALPNTLGTQCLVLNLSDGLHREYAAVAKTLRAHSISTETYLEPTKLEKQFKYAERKGIKLAIIFGESEQQQSQVKIKDLIARTEVVVPFDQLAENVKKLLS